MTFRDVMAAEPPAGLALLRHHVFSIADKFAVGSTKSGQRRRSGDITFEGYVPLGGEPVATREIWRRC